ncbi:E3 ubiquitin-protein ligase FANCL isoform X2 [Phoenix dactylifera]|uniref:E3 ubiquitin-protein ligase FANCL isoform X2 n=1 Tax=Phoenix dactylifera TaxID=42345 RepID=A0A8B8J2V8_PHODC|nr:E3 ubiquitin-protein ligase FANCL isoform X2 [Phoenix dactylifera]
MEQSRRREPPPPPPFYRSIFSEIEEVGWEHLIRSEEDLSSLSFRILDKKGRAHILEIALPRNYPEGAPSIAADVPYICDIEWSKSSKLKNILQQFREKLQEFWSIMEDIDRNLWILDPKQPSLATSYRQICLGNDCYLLLYVYARNPWSLPECHFFGPDSTVDLLRKNWRKNGRKWTKDKPFHENLATLLETTLPRPHTVSNENDEQVDCGICYAQYLPVDDEFGDNSGSAPDYTCENLSCSRAFHTVCLRDWLRSITTTRQSFDVLFGNCPYCSESVAVKVGNCS